MWCACPFLRNQFVRKYNQLVSECGLTCSCEYDMHLFYKIKFYYKITKFKNLDRYENQKKIPCFQNKTLYNF